VRLAVSTQTATQGTSASFLQTGHGFQSAKNSFNLNQNSVSVIMNVLLTNSVGTLNMKMLPVIKTLNFSMKDIRVAWNFIHKTSTKFLGGLLTSLCPKFGT
jgi:hypothetical protein